MQYGELKQKLQHYYEIDLDNCLMDSNNWIEELAKALTDPKKYLEEFNAEYKIYLNRE